MIVAYADTAEELRRDLLQRLELNLKGAQNTLATYIVRSERGERVLKRDMDKAEADARFWKAEVDFLKELHISPKSEHVSNRKAG